MLVFVWGTILIHTETCQVGLHFVFFKFLTFTLIIADTWAPTRGARTGACPLPLENKQNLFGGLSPYGKLFVTNVLFFLCKGLFSPYGVFFRSPLSPPPRHKNFSLYL